MNQFFKAVDRVPVQKSKRAEKNDHFLQETNFHERLFFYGYKRNSK